MAIDTTVATMVENILTIHANATETDVYEGTHWYNSAHQFAQYLASTYNVSIDVAACVIAAHSMNASWKANQTRAINQLSGNPTGLGAAITMGERATLWRELELTTAFDAIVGPKINPFARNIAGDLFYVATDRWAQRAAFNSLDDKANNNAINRKGVRTAMINAYQLAAGRVGLEPAVMQAIVWVVVRGSAE